MTKKDYIVIANGLKLLVDSAKVSKHITDEQFFFIVNQTINKFVRDLETENPRFNKEKFLAAINK